MRHQTALQIFDSHQDERTLNYLFSLKVNYLFKDLTLLCNLKSSSNNLISVNLVKLNDLSLKNTGTSPYFIRYVTWHDMMEAGNAAGSQYVPKIISSIKCQAWAIYHLSIIYQTEPDCVLAQCGLMQQEFSWFYVLHWALGMQEPPLDTISAA